MSRLFKMLIALMTVAVSVQAVSILEWSNCLT